jgi:hypothetical protein
MDLELRLIRYFLAVAEELNFNRSAERVHVSPPSLSVAIQKLEEHCGFTLFGPPRISEYSGTLRNSFWSHTIVTESTGVIVDTDVNPGAGLQIARRRFDKPGFMLPVHRLDLLPSFPQYLLLRE